MNENVLILGFFFRNNMGDDAYIIAFQQLFGHSSNIKYISMDDLDVIPQNVDVVICGGGDIINSYFMDKAYALLSTFTGRIYAVSVGIPFINNSKYLTLFDHIFVRSSNDVELSRKYIGTQNITQINDITMILQNHVFIKKIPYYNSYTLSSFGNKNINIGLSLAQPYFYKNPCKTQLINALVNIILTLVNNKKNNYTFYILPFNQFDKNDSECDYVICDDFYKILKSNNIKVKINLQKNLNDYQQMMNFIGKNIDVMLCMRYHSAIFSLITNTRFVPIYSSQKIDNLIHDLDYQYYYKMTTDVNFKPTYIDEKKLLESINLAILNRVCDFTDYVSKIHYHVNNIKDVIVKQKKTKNIFINTKHLDDLDNVIALCKIRLCKFLNITPGVFDEILHQRGKLNFNNEITYDPLNLARFICYIISGNTSHSCVWGLSENFNKDTFNLFDAIKYIWDECEKSIQMFEHHEHYYPYVHDLGKRTFVNVDYVFKNDFSQFHRSGWSYVIGGIMNLDAHYLSRESDILIDTYVDRSFHWGCVTLKNVGILPYKQKWYGFVHHTFDTSHSNYNCVEMFNNPCFIESLEYCQGLIALSKYLQQGLIDALQKINMGHVKVYTLYHPMENVDNLFTMKKFIDNKNKSIVQIGAWLRNPYGIYQLDLYNLQKVALKGREMDLYFPPNDYINFVETEFRSKWECNKESINTDSFCKICRMCHSNHSNNKFINNIADMLEEQYGSVIILERLSNEEYDNLLSNNIVFLNLVDCSAVNTVLECIVRNTPIIVNRLPALEEVLGSDYPGFYTKIVEANNICNDFDKITSIYLYLTRMNKTRFNLDHFINKFQTIINGNYKQEDYSIFNDIVDNIKFNKLNIVKKYLPQSFLN